MSQKPSLSNWRLAPYSKWTFQHVNQIIPTATIRSGSVKASFESNLLSDLDQSIIDTKSHQTLNNHLDETFTDNLVILHHGQLIYRWNAPYCDITKPHILFSISKSISAIIAGILQHQNLLDVSKPVSFYLPDCKGSGYEDATVQQVLDMTVALDFEESYLTPDGDYRRYRDATGWNPVDQRNPGPDLETFLYSLKKSDKAHGEVFEYKSPNSDLLGLLLERVAGIPYADLVSQLLWQPMGANNDAYVTVDRSFLARGAGGICTTIDDLARIGQLINERGAVANKQIIPEHWIDDTATKGNRQAWLKGDFVDLAPKGCYRNKWYLSGDKDCSSMAIGIHGQWLYINPAKQIVIAKQASQPEPVDDELDIKSIQLFRKICNLLTD